MADETQTVRQDIEAAIDAAVSATDSGRTPPAPSPPSKPIVPRETRPEPPPKQVESEAGPQADQTGGDSVHESREREEQEREGVDRPRDQFGRFTRTPEGRAPEQPEARPVEPAPAISDQPESVAQEQGDLPAILVPQAWSAAAKDSWHQLPRAIQEEVDRRERDVSRALQQRAEQANVLEPIVQAIQPYSQKLALRGINPASVVTQLLAVQDLLDRDPIEGIAYVARSYGVDLRNFATAFAQSQQPQDPAMRELSDRVSRQDQMLQQWRQAAEAQEMQRIQGEVQRFAASRDYPYFDQVRERMAHFMERGSADDLAHAYRLAVAENDDIGRQIKQREEQQLLTARRQSEKHIADRARKAAVSVSGSPYGGGSVPNGNAGSGSVRDAIASAIEQVASQ
jgi:hypothetical protein